MIEQSRKHPLQYHDGMVAVLPCIEPMIPPKRIRTAKKSVRFSACQVFTLHLASSKETWYDQEEYHDFRRLCKQDIIAYAKAQKVGRWDTGEHCIRGLEGIFPPATKQTLGDRKKQRFYAVLGEQHLQRVAGTSDPEAMACLSRMFSKRSLDRALEVARKDALVWNKW